MSFREQPRLYGRVCLRKPACNSESGSVSRRAENIASSPQKLPASLGLNCHKSPRRRPMPRAWISRLLRLTGPHRKPNPQRQAKQPLRFPPTKTGNRSRPPLRSPMRSVQNRQSKLRLSLPTREPYMPQIKQLCAEYPGDVPVYLLIADEGITILLDSAFWTSAAGVRSQPTWRCWEPAPRSCARIDGGFAGPAVSPPLPRPSLPNAALGNFYRRLHLAHGPSGNFIKTPIPCIRQA